MLQRRQRSLLGSFSGFDQVPLLQTLEAVLEDAALWLQRQSIAQGEGGKRQAKTNVALLRPNAQFPPKLKNLFTTQRVI